MKSKEVKNMTQSEIMNRNSEAISERNRVSNIED